MSTSSFLPSFGKPENKIKSLFLLLFLLIVTNAAVSGVRSAETNWVTLTSVRDLTDNVAVQSDQPLIAGHAYNFTFTIDVPFTQSQSAFFVALEPSMMLHSSQFWYVHTPAYPGYNATLFTAGAHTVSLSQYQGQIQMSVVFRLPQGYTLHSADGLTRHFMRQNVSVVSVSVTGGATVGSITRNISDEAIQNYLNAYAQKSTLISQGKISPAYASVVNGILEQGQAIYQMGLPEKALDVINNVDPSKFPAPPDNTLNMALFAAVGVLGVVAALLGLMMARARGRASFAAGVMSDAQRELATLEVTAAQYDKKLADRLRSLKERLGESI